MIPSNLLDALQKGNASTRLRVVPDSERQDRSSAEAVMTSMGPEMNATEETEARNYFFEAGVDSWIGLIEDMTFPTSSCELKPTEAQIIVEHWQKQAAVPSEAPDKGILLETKEKLQALRQRLQVAIQFQAGNSPVSRVFVKLSTRSPKDSKKILVKASAAYQDRIRKLQQDDSGASDKPLDSNTKWKILAKEVANASAVDNVDGALDLLLDSHRVFQDLEYALEGFHERATANSADRPSWNVSVAARAWNPSIQPATEFRGICWNGNMTCLCQYFHTLYFAEIVENKDEIECDIRKCMQQPNVQAAIQQLGGHCIIDFARTGPGKVLIVELNPFDGVGLGTFPASTGLFLWDDPIDKRIMQGLDPFEFRVRTTPMPDHKLKTGSERAWHSIIYNNGASSLS